VQRVTRGSVFRTATAQAALAVLMLASTSSLVCHAQQGSTAALEPPQKADSTTNVAHPDSTFDKERFTREVLKSKDLPNFHEVHPFLYRSGEPTEEGLRKAKSMGIRTLIDLRGGDKSKQEAEWAKSLGMRYINLPMSSQPPTKPQVDQLLTTVKHAQANPKDGSVLVHCAHGSDRTGCMIGIWRVTQEGWNYDDAYKEMRHYWFTPKFTRLSDSVREYAQSSSAKKTATPAIANPAVH
jgi:protein tyrosine/serine phosphatase